MNDTYVEFARGGRCPHTNKACRGVLGLLRAQSAIADARRQTINSDLTPDQAQKVYDTLSVQDGLVDWVAQTAAKGPCTHFCALAGIQVETYVLGNPAPNTGTQGSDTQPA